MTNVERHRVLFVEDHEDTREIYVSCMLAAGWQVDSVATGIDAVEAAARFLPDVIVMDLHLPVIDGLEATRRLRDDPRTAHIRVVACTAFASQHETELRAAGFLLVVPKPCEPDDLLVLLEGLADGWVPP
jgi:CheY-like chemotaxis protein